MNQSRDDIYKNPIEDIAGFQFDDPVVKVFKDMISRSVPGYNLILSLLGVLSAKYAKDNSNCYDLGCSLGASTLAMRHNINAKHCNIISIDNSAPMIQQCIENIEQDNSHVPVNVLLCNILDHTYTNASITVMNFTLQFIPLHLRSTLISKIAAATCNGGVLLISEKIVFNDPVHERAIYELHHQFKKNNGYSDLEVAQKRESLENILIPETIQAHKKRLLDSGFSDVFIGLQCFNFVSLIAIK